MDVPEHYDLRICARCARQCRPTSSDFWACPEHGAGWAKSIEVVPASRLGRTVKALEVCRTAFSTINASNGATRAAEDVLRDVLGGQS